MTGWPPQRLEIEWSKVNADLYTRFFTGRAKAVACCHACDSTQHLAHPGQEKRIVITIGQKRWRTWASDVCALFNSSGVCSFGP